MTAKKARPRTRSVIGQRALEAVRGSTARRFQWQLRQKLPHREGNFFDLCFEREMSAIEESNRGVRVVASECLGTRGNKVEILLPPYCVQRRSPFPEIFVESGIKLHIVGVGEKEVELNVHVVRPRHEGGVEGITLRYNHRRIFHADRLFPTYAVRIENLPNASR